MIPFLYAACISYFVGWPMRRLLLAWNVVDNPNSRSSHSRPTPRGGGLGVVVAFGTVVGFQCIAGNQDAVLWGLLGTMLAVAVVSFWDDIRSVSIQRRLVWQIIAAVAFLGVLGYKVRTSNDHALLWCGGMGALLWIVGYTNAFNFMDGVNGLATGQAAISTLGMGLLGAGIAADPLVIPSVALFAMAGAATGFLPHNFPRARMFLGDAGSATLGFGIAALTVWLSTIGGWSLFVAILLLHSNFVLDTGATLVRRIYRGENWCEAHREHFYQRLVRAGRSHTFVTVREIAAQVVVLSVLYFWYLDSGLGGRVASAVTIVCIRVALLAHAEQLFNRARRKDR